MSNRIEVLPSVLGDLALRVSKGARQYGEPLTTRNGRDALTDGYEEALDLALYLKQAILERSSRPPAPSPVEPVAEAAKCRYCDRPAASRVIWAGQKWCGLCDPAHIAKAAKFKVGQRVRVKNTDITGEVVKAATSATGAKICEDSDGEEWFYFEDQLELAEAATPATTSEARTTWGPGVPAVEAAYRTPAANEATTTREEFNEAKEREADAEWRLNWTAVDYVGFVNGWIAHARRTS